MPVFANVTANMVVTSNKLGCNNCCYEKVRRKKCYDKAAHISCKDKASLAGPPEEINYICYILAF